MVTWIPHDIDKIYYLEEGLQSIVQDVCKHVGYSDIKDKVKYMNKSKHSNFKKYYDPDTALLLEEIYKDDFERFRYSYLHI